MGGAILGQYLRHAPQAGDVIAAVLDAPALDLRATLQHFVAAKRLPLSGAVTWTATQITPWRVGIRLDDTLTLPCSPGGPGSCSTRTATPTRWCPSSSATSCTACAPT
jgi:hypothetical protein